LFGREAIGGFQFGRRPNVVLAVGELFARTRSPLSGAPVLLLAVGGFQFGRRPKLLLAVGDIFVRARSACIIARRRRFSIQPKANVLLAVDEFIVRARSARSQAQSACVIARRKWVSIRPKASSLSGREAPVVRREAHVLLSAIGERYLLVGPRQAPRRPKVRRPPQTVAAKPLV